MIDRGDGLRLADQAHAELLVVRQIREHHLERRLAAEQDVLGLEHLAHAALADQPDDLIAGDPATCLQPHLRSSSRGRGRRCDLDLGVRDPHAASRAGDHEQRAADRCVDREHAE